MHVPVTSAMPGLAETNNAKTSPLEPAAREKIEIQSLGPGLGLDQAVSESTAPYTVFTRSDKRLLTILLGFTTITSPLTATIYLPLLPLLRADFHTSAQAINLTITIYIIFQALSPAIFGPLSDSLGRRPVFLFTLILYVVGNLGLALNSQKHYYGVLVTLRALQSLGASAAYAVSYGVAADVCVPGERGRMVGPVGMALNLGACVGPVIGGWVAYRSKSYEWVFWMLVIVGAVLLLAVGTFLPETARAVVGNGRRGRGERIYWWDLAWWGVVKKNMALLSFGTRSQKDESEKGAKNTKDERPILSKRAFHLPNPLSCLRIIFHKDTFLALWMHASFYTVDYSLVAALPDIYASIYKYNELEIGLSYLPRGAGIIIGSYCNGKFMDYSYKLTARKIGRTINTSTSTSISDATDLSHFPIERARSRGAFLLLAISTTTLIGFGWAVHYKAHVSVLYILQFIQGFWTTCFYITYNTLLVDLFPESPSTAAAAASITRCTMAATGVTVLQPLLDRVGRGWYFSILGIWSGGFGGLVVWLIGSKGMEWRVGRRKKGEDKARAKGKEKLRVEKADGDVNVNVKDTMSSPSR